MKKLFFSLLLCSFCFSYLKAQFTEVSTPINQGNQGFSAWLDVDNDGDLDLLVNSNSYVNGEAVSNGTKIFKNTNGSFSSTGTDLGLFYKGDVDLADFDGDDDVDLAIMGKAAIDVWGQAGMAKIFRNDNGVFTDINAGLPQICNGDLKWGDIDNDGDPDLIMTGYDANVTPIIAVMQNNKGVFQAIANHGLPAAVYGSIDLADYNKDGFLDVLMSGGPQGSTFTAIFKNNQNNTFSNINQSFVGMSVGSVKWGDYDADGDLDFIVTGSTNGWTVTGCSTLLYRNSNGNFANSGISFQNVFLGETAFGDLDNDGDLEVFVTGGGASSDYTRIYQYSNGTYTAYADLQGGNESSLCLGDFNKDGKLDFFNAGYSSQVVYAKLYKNNTPTANSAPTLPSNLLSVVNKDVVTLSWNAASDTKTPAAALEYNFYIGSSTKAQDIASAMADPSTGFRKLANKGNAGQNKSISISKLKPGKYYWSVQSIDGAYANSAFAAEQSFTVVSTLAVSSSTVSLASAAGSKTSFAVSSNTDWTISCNQTWLKLGTTTGKGDASIDATAELNPGTSKRTAIITISAIGVASKTITLTQEASPANLSLSASSLSFAASANSSKTFTITSNTSWTVSCDQAWVTISARTGSNSSTISLTVKENTSFSPRTANLLITPKGAAVSSIALSQNAAAPFISASPSNLNLSAGANSKQSFSISSNTSWTISCNQDWLSFSKTAGSGNETITVTASANTAASSRTASINISITGNGCSLQLTQAAMVTALDEVPENSFSLYPNPVSDVLYFDASIHSAEVCITSLGGSVVLKQSISTNSLSVAGLPVGLYWITVITKGKTIQRKFIKQ